jgi:transcriptional regulator
MAPGVMERMMRMILPFRLAVADVAGTWKLNQNKPEAARLGAASGVEGGTPGAETAALAALMREPPGA